MKPKQIEWENQTLIFIDDVPGFRDWLHGQTCPLVENDPNPFGWAYYSDYLNFINSGQVTD